MLEVATRRADVPVTVACDLGDRRRDIEKRGVLTGCAKKPRIIGKHRDRRSSGRMSHAFR